MTFLQLGRIDLSQVNGGIQWIDGPQDVTLMLRVDKQNAIDEPLLTDGTPEISYQFALEGVRNPGCQPHEHRIALIVIKAASYVFTKHAVVVCRNLRLEDVLPQWIALNPKLGIALEMTG